MKKSSPSDSLIEDYLEEVNAALRPLSVGRRKEIVDDIAAHINEDRDAFGRGDLASLRNLLDRVGDPSDLAREILATEEVSTPRASSDTFVPWLVLLGAIAFGIGWLIGVVLLWRSTTWRIKDKVVATLIWPGGIFGVYIVFLLHPTATGCGSSGGPGQPTVTHCTTSGLVVASPWNVILAVMLLIAPIAVFVRLTWIKSRGYRS